MISYEDIKKANESIKTTTISRTDKKTGKTISKEYAEVNERVKAFRMVHPNGHIHTEMISNDVGSDQKRVCIFRASIYADSAQREMLSTGTAYEKEGSSFINDYSYIENCETSAVGRALGFAGFGIDTSIASFDEVSNAMANQSESPRDDGEKIEKKATPKQIEYLKEVYKGENLGKLLKANGLEKIEDMSISKASELISKIKKGEKKA